jgi:hypothetical protein
MDERKIMGIHDDAEEATAGCGLLQYTLSVDFCTIAIYIAA